MRASRLDRLISIEYPAESKDPDYGANTKTWLPLVTLPGSPTLAAKMYACYEPVPPSRSEAVKQGLNVALNMAKFTIRYRTDVDSSMRIILYDGSTSTVYNIIGGPAEIGRREWLELMGERVSS